MTCYNGEYFLDKALKSIINQTYPNWELIFTIIFQMIDL